MFLWLDLELRKDIDDYITLLIALKQKIYKIKYISIHNPSKEELNLLKNTLNLYKRNDIEIIISGNILTYKKEENINNIFYKKVDLIKENTEFKVIFLENKVKEQIDFKNLVFFGGGSLYTLSKILEEHNINKAYIQGGYAGSNIIPKNKTLQKFKNRKEVPSWNLNLDIEATLKVLNNNNNKLIFISKNICHSAIITENDIQNLNNNNFISKILKIYFENSSYKEKAMHDVLAFFSILYSNLIKFKKVNLKYIIKKKTILLVF